MGAGHLSLANRRDGAKQQSRERRGHLRSGCPSPRPRPAPRAKGSHRDVHAEPRFSEPQPAAAAAAPFTLGVDIGGTNIKASVLDGAGRPGRRADPHAHAQGGDAAGRARRRSPSLAVAAAPLRSASPSGFPGVVKGGKVVTAPNLGTEHWAGFELSRGAVRSASACRCACSTTRPCRASASSRATGSNAC